MNPLVQLGRLGQSPWYDFITRDLLRSGTLARLIADDGLLGMTSNPTIFEKAITTSADYDVEIERYAERGDSAEAIVEQLMVADVREACDIFRPVYERTDGRDGLVSIEVSPTLAADTAGTIAAAVRLWHAVGRPNAMIKIPGTREGLPAVRDTLAQGINVNVTLLFAVDRYEAVLEAFQRGVEARLAAGGSVNRLASVASFFVSRVDGKADPILRARGADHLLGTAAIANAAAAYAAFRRMRETARWKALEARGARVQRPLWASTSTKNPAYLDVHYVEPLIAPDTVNTLPPATFDAYRDHGRPAVRLPARADRVEQELAALAAAGIDLGAIASVLEEEGVASFGASFASLVGSVNEKVARGKVSHRPFPPHTQPLRQ